MRNLHSINFISNLSERELANLWDKHDDYKFKLYKDIIYYNSERSFKNSDWYDIWDNDGYSAAAMERWIRAGKPIPLDKFKRIEKTNTPFPIFKTKRT